MNSDFPRILSLLRKERGISQKQASEGLNISQALLSHYEKGIRECGLDFVVRSADFYGVSCDYLLGRSPERAGHIIVVDEIPEGNENHKENQGRAGLMPVLHKKLIINSVHILFDLIAKCGNKTVISECSNTLMMTVYKLFRKLYGANEKNVDSFFAVSSASAENFANAAMFSSDAKLDLAISGAKGTVVEPISNTDELSMTTESISRNYPLYASSLLNLIQNCESRFSITKKTSSKS